MDTEHGTAASSTDADMDETAAWVAGGPDTLTRRVIDAIPPDEQTDLFYVRAALLHTLDVEPGDGARHPRIDPAFAFGAAGGLAFALDLDETQVAIIRLSRLRGVAVWGAVLERPGAPHRSNVADAVDAAVTEIRERVQKADLDAAEVWCAGGADALTSRLAHAVPADDGPLELIRLHLSVAAGDTRHVVGDPGRFGPGWTLGVASGIAKSLELHRVDAAIVMLATLHRVETYGPDADDDPDRSRTRTVEAVEAAVDELHDRHGDGQP